ncbi:hypothetical protein D3877_16295 [Azospirillum cavernae]|uniref:Antirepressor protein C-terminal domain-containing protein n=1 Tax=Azospirillum cavernae TaxID=2320860 RepID=A0A418VX00_9PROT|nr:phage regulatory protein/antirepressor Ant [Azospirillum cavernae]RJF81681.1 hypothetical protein D3877_16295 [Azospirillum cavernae]
MINSATATSTGPESDPLPVVFERDGKVFANSRDVSAFFGKRNADVNRAIRDLIADLPPEHAQRNFAPNEIKDLTGPSVSDYDMTRDGFTLLAMGFTGSKALTFKLRYIDQFNAMESALKSRAAGFAIPGTLSEALRLAADQADTIEKQKLQIEAAKPVVDAFDRIANADGTMCPTDAAKALQVRPKVLFDFMRANKWTYCRPGKPGDIGYQDKIQNGYLVHKVTTVQRPDGSDKTTERVHVTPKGLARLAMMVPGAKGINGNHPGGGLQ